MDNKHASQEAHHDADSKGLSLPSRDAASVSRIQQLLAAKDDTQRFVGLALLKSVLDNSQPLRDNDQVVQLLWASLSPKFLDRLLRTGSKPSGRGAKPAKPEMPDLAVSVLHTFAALLPEQSRGQSGFTGCIPGLVGAALYRHELGQTRPLLLSPLTLDSPPETTTRLLQLLHTLASSPGGARALVGLDDLSPLTEIAPQHALVLDTLRFAFLNAINAMTAAEDKRALSLKVDQTVQGLVSSFTGTDAVTLLEFLGSFLRQADSTILPSEPKWLKTVSGYIRNLAASRPTPEARPAYTNAAASLLQAYPSAAPRLLFADEPRSERPFAYLLVNLVLIDVRSSAPTLLQQLNTPAYPQTSRRLASAFDVVCIFIGYLVCSLDDESLDSLVMSPDSLLKLRKRISETMSVTIEYLRDRWDASVAGAMGLHLDARVGTAETATGSHRTLTWDSIATSADDDPLILSAVRALALWLREDDNGLLRKEASGLMDMLMDLYRASASERLDFRSPVLVALEALVVADRGRVLFLRHDGWHVLNRDLDAILRESSAAGHEGAAARGTDIIRILLHVAEQEPAGTAEEWMDLVTTVAAWDVPADETASPAEHEFQVAVLQLCCTLLARASGGMRNRYRHSIGAIHGVASQLGRRIGRHGPVGEQMEDVMATLDGLA